MLRIVPLRVTGRKTRTLVFWELPLGHSLVAELDSPPKQQEEKGSGALSHTPMRSDPKHSRQSEASVFELSVSVASSNGSLS
jgi:hypothetical protein